MSSRSDSCPNGFTLVEMVAVVVLLSLLVSVVGLSFQQPLRRARIKSEIDRIDDFFRGASHNAVRSGQSVRIIINAAEGSISEDRRNGRELRLGGGLQIDRVESAGQSPRRRFSLQIAPTGQFESLAMRLERVDRTRFWIVILGASGQCLTVEDDDVATLRAARIR